MDGVSVWHAEELGRLVEPALNFVGVQRRAHDNGLGPQKDPNSGRTRVESGPAGTHRPTTRRGSAIVQSRRQPDQRRPHRETSAHRLRRRWTSASRRRGHRRIDAGDIDAGETSAHRIEGEADPLLVVTEECLARRGCGPARAIVTPDAWDRRAPTITMV